MNILQATALIKPSKYYYYSAIILLLNSCQIIGSGKNGEPLPSSEFDTSFVSTATHEHCDSTILQLERSFQLGQRKPMSIITNSNFNYLLNSPTCRIKLKGIIKKHANESSATMVSNKEPGKRISLTGTIADEATGLPLKNVLVELVHTDNNGVYFTENTQFNTRLFAYLKTDENGKFSINTIRPKGYLDDEGNPVAAHIHFTLEKEGYRLYASELTFSDDSIIMAQGNVEQVPLATPKKGSKNHYEVYLPMQKQP